MEKGKPYILGNALTTVGDFDVFASVSLVSFSNSLCIIIGTMWWRGREGACVETETETKSEGVWRDVVWGTTLAQHHFPSSTDNSTDLGFL